MKSFTGSVTSCEVELKMLTSTLIQELMNAKSAPATTPGLICGRVIRKNAWKRLAPRSCAASSSVRSEPASEASVVLRVRGHEHDVTDEERPEAARKTEGRCVLQDRGAETIVGSTRVKGTAR